MNSFDCIIWKNTPVVKGIFSLKNPQYGKNNLINGLNLGYNTPEKPEITQAHRNVWFSFAGANPETTATGKQVHGDHIEIVSSGGVYENTDGFVSATPGVSLGIFVADCGGILLADEQQRIVGACHAGWKGALLGIVPKTINKMIELGAKVNAINAFISPCIAAKNFEVGEEVAVQFPYEFVYRGNHRPHVDLKGYIRQQLIDSGVNAFNIDISEGCTVADENSFYSYRREGTKSGRMMAIITLKNLK